MTALRRHIAILFAVLLMALAPSCSKKHVPAVEPGTGTAALSLPQRYQLLSAAYADWLDVYAPVSFSIDEPTSMSVSGRCTMIRGKEILLSMRFLGMDVAGIYINTDSLIFVDKFHKRYVAAPIADTLAAYGITVSDIQDLLLGQAFAPSAGRLTPQMAKALDFAPLDDSRWAIMPKNGDIPWFYTADVADTPTVTALNIAIPGRSPITAVFSLPTATVAGPVAREISAATELNATKLVFGMQWNLSSAKWDSGRTITFSIPKGARQIPLSAVPEMLKSL